MTDSERLRGASLQPLRALAPFIWPYRAQLAAAAVALLLAAAAQLSLPIALRYLIDRGFLAENAVSIDRYFIAIFVVAVLFGLFSALRFYLVVSLGEKVVADIRNAVFRHVIRLDTAFFEVTKSGEVLSRLTTDTTLIQSISGAGLSIALRSAVTLSGALLMLSLTSPRLAGMTLLLVPLVLVPVIAVGRRVRRLSRDSQDRIADTSGLAGEALNAIATVQAFTLERLQTDRYSQAVRVALATALRRIRVRSALTALAIIFIFGAVTLVLWVGTRAVMDGEMTGGQLGQFLLYAIFAAGASAGLSEMWGEIQRASGAMERIVELLATVPAIVAPVDPIQFPQDGAGSVRFENVSFAYPSRPEALALRELTLDVQRGETVAVVGPSGAGKSTLVQLLLRFFDPQFGRILVDGIDITTVDPVALRARIGLVPQDTVIFGTSASENIRYGRQEATPAQIRAAAVAAAADDFIRALPEGYETFLGERGARLSGGQRQRIAIARAMLKDPPILLLDEATSALDAESERVVQAALDRLMRDRATLVIAHRLATVRKADRIVVMDSGRIVDIGRHDTLLKRDTLYRKLARLQFASDSEGESP